MELFIGFVIGGFLGAWLLYLRLQPKIKQTEAADYSTAQLNAQLVKEYDYNLLKLKSLKEEIENARNQIEVNRQKIIDLQADFTKTSKENEKAAQNYYDKMMSLQKQKLAIDLKEEQERYDKAVEEYRQEYAKVLFGAADEFKKEFELKNAHLQLLKDDIEHEHSIALAAIEANKRAKEMKEKENFYRLVLSQEDLDEIATLRKTHLRNPEPLNKVIWKVYYEKPYTDLIGRVVGSGIHTGIYKITNLQDGMCYVGQAVNIADRWKQHIRRGIGADTPTRNKLYPAMLSFGVENFSFEIVEECEKDKLNEREDYWQEYFKAKEFGYSIK